MTNHMLLHQLCAMSSALCHLINCFFVISSLSSALRSDINFVARARGSSSSAFFYDIGLLTSALCSDISLTDTGFALCHQLHEADGTAQSWWHRVFRSWWHNAKLMAPRNPQLMGWRGAGAMATAVAVHVNTAVVLYMKEWSQKAWSGMDDIHVTCVLCLPSCNRYPGATDIPN